VTDYFLIAYYSINVLCIYQPHR